MVQGFMKVGPALVRPDGKMVGEWVEPTLVNGALA